MRLIVQLVFVSTSSSPLLSLMDSTRLLLAALIVESVAVPVVMVELFAVQQKEQPEAMDYQMRQLHSVLPVAMSLLLTLELVQLKSNQIFGNRLGRFILLECYLSHLGQLVLMATLAEPERRCL